MKEYAIGHSNGEIKRRNMEDIPSGRDAMRAHAQSEMDFFDIDKMPGGNTRENVKILAERLSRYEMQCKGVIPNNGPEFRGL